MTKVYVGNLPAAVSEEELEKKFGSFGKIISIDIKVPPRPPAFAFLQFEVEAEAQAAVDALHDKEFGEEGSGKMKVEFSVSKGPRESGGERGEGGGRRGRSDFRVIVSGMPRDISWQDRVLRRSRRKRGKKPRFTSNGATAAARAASKARRDAEDAAAATAAAIKKAADAIPKYTSSGRRTGECFFFLSSSYD